MKDYVEAIAAYDMAIANDENDVVSYVYRGESQILSSNVEAGLKDLDKVLQIGSQYPQFAPWVQRSELLIRLHTLATNGPARHHPAPLQIGHCRRLTCAIGSAPPRRWHRAQRRIGQSAARRSCRPRQRP